MHDGAFFENLRIFSHDYLKCCGYLCRIQRSSRYFTKKLYSTLIASSQLLEDFLDYHGAKNNKNWYFYRELSAAVRHLSIAGYSQRHIANRLMAYDLPEDEEFKQQGEANIGFLTQCLINMAPVILDEARRLKIPFPAENFTPLDFPSVRTDEVLEADIDDEDRDQQKKHIVKIASEFLTIARSFEQLGLYRPFNEAEMAALVPEKVNEVEIMRYEVMVHNLQSSFDTYVIYGGSRFGNLRLKQLRSNISLIFHLLQMIGRMLHFYERHLHEAGYKSIYKEVQQKLYALIDPKRLMDFTVNYGLYYVCYFLATGNELARNVLNENIERRTLRVGIPMNLGFHCRPSLLVAKIVQHYGGQVELCIGPDRFDAGSVLDIQWAGGKIQKEKITEVVFEGDARALNDLQILARVNYGEDTMGKGIPLPQELGYLR